MVPTASEKATLPQVRHNRNITQQAYLHIYKLVDVIYTKCDDQVVDQLDAHLLTRSTLAGNSVTIADYALAAAIKGT